MIKRKRVGRPPSKSAEYRMMVCQEIVGGKMTYREASKTFGVSSGAISAWLRDYKAGKLMDPKAVEDSRSRMQRYEENISELKAEIAELYLQNQILKKSIAYMNSKKKGGSFVITSENLDQYREDAE
jgi:transposase-like protein